MKRRINHGQATRSTLMCSRVIHFMIAPGSLSGCEIGSRGLLRTSDGLIDDHPRDRLSVLFLLRRVNTMRPGINSEAMDCMLDAKVFQLAVVVWIILMENGKGAAITRDIDASQTSIKFDDIGSVGQRQKGDGCVLVEIENGHQVVLFTREERAVVLRVQHHSVIALA